MLSIEPVLEHVVPFMLVMFRMAGLLIFAPLLGSSVINPRVKLFLALTLSASVYPFMPAFQEEIPLSLVSLVPVILSESLLGMSIGLMAGIPIAMMDLAGFIMGHKMGFGMARVFNPAMDDEADIIGQMIFYVALGVFLTLGGLEVIFLSLLRTFDNIPIGAMALSDTPGPMLIALLASGLEMAVRLSLPVLGALYLQTLASGFIMKTMPQINILSVGFSIKIISGLIVLLLSLGSIQQVVVEESQKVLDEVYAWALTISGSGDALSTGLEPAVNPHVTPHLQRMEGGGG